MGGMGKPGGLGSGIISMQRSCTLLEWACDSGSRVVVRIDAQVCCHDYLQPRNREGSLCQGQANAEYRTALVLVVKLFCMAHKMCQFHQATRRPCIRHAR